MQARRSLAPPRPAPPVPSWVAAVLALLESYRRCEDFLDLAGDPPDDPPPPMRLIDSADLFSRRDNPLREPARQHLRSLGLARLAYLDRLYGYGRDRICGNRLGWKYYTGDSPYTEGVIPYLVNDILLGKINVVACVTRALQDRAAVLAAPRSTP